MSQIPALALVHSDLLRAELQALLPAYHLYWDLQLHGALGRVADMRPAFLLVDVDAPPATWHELVLALQTSPATRRLPITALCAAVTPERIAQTQALSLAPPIPRPTWPTALVTWVAENARIWDADYYARLESACQDELPPLAIEGIRLFDAHDFWEAHEVLEHAWVETRPAPISDVYRSILQVGVAYYQIQKGNYRGALKMFLRAVQWLDPLPDVCQGLDLAQFKRDAAAARTELERLGPEGIAAFDRSLFKPVPRVSMGT